MATPRRDWDAIVIGLGAMVAELSIDGVTPSAAELEAFRIDRPILLEKDPPNSWMV